MKIIILNIYFGKRPDYFDLFLYSCGVNQLVDFLFFVDFDIPLSLPSNVRIIKTTFEDIRADFQSDIPFPIALNSPYKLTDFQPAYGELLADYLENYDWWGHCDFDMVFGDLTPVVKVAEQAQYVKIFRRGHLTLYKNSKENNGIYKNIVGTLSYRDIFSSEKFFNFDETNGIDKIFATMGLPVFREELIADINPKSPFLYMTAHPNQWGQYFIWSHGKLLCKNGMAEDNEYIYIHFQKRKMAEHYRITIETPPKILINQFGLFGAKSNLRWINRILVYFPNLAHLRRFFLPRIVKFMKSKFAA